MDAGEILGSLVISIFATAFVYLLVPVIVLLRDKEYTEKQLKKIAIINAIAVWFICRILESVMLDSSSTGASVFLWGWVGYMLLKRKLTHPLPKNTGKELLYLAIIVISIIVIVSCVIIFLMNL